MSWKVNWHPSVFSHFRSLIISISPRQQQPHTIKKKGSGVKGKILSIWRWISQDRLKLVSSLFFKKKAEMHPFISRFPTHIKWPKRCLHFFNNVSEKHHCTWRQDHQPDCFNFEECKSLGTQSHRKPQLIHSPKCSALQPQKLLFSLFKVLLEIHQALRLSHSGLMESSSPNVLTHIWTWISGPNCSLPWKKK